MKLLSFVLLSVACVFASCTVMPSVEPSSQNSDITLHNTVKTSLTTAEEEMRDIPVHKKQHIPILMYHYVEDVENKKDKGRINLSVRPETFEKELQALNAQQFKTYFVKELPLLFSEETQKKVQKKVILTFDDGYEDFYTVVFPLLQKYHVKGTLYVIADFVDRPDYITSSQLQEIIDSGLVEIGGHTNTHPHLSYLSKEKQYDEIVTSKKEFEKKFGVTLRTFAYPFGDYKKGVTDTLVREAGYSFAVTVENGYIQDSDALFELKRIRAGTVTGNTIVSVLEKME